MESKDQQKSLDDICKDRNKESGLVWRLQRVDYDRHRPYILGVEGQLTILNAGDCHYVRLWCAIDGQWIN